jgi:hypothetical protein
MNFDWQKVTESKEAHRRKLAALPIAEKLSMLDAMRERGVALRHARSAELSVAREEPSSDDASKGVKQ